MTERSDTRHVVLIRHAKSSWDDPGLADHDRPLAPRGRKALSRMRDHLAGLDVQPELVVCSPARRTRETLAGVLDAFTSRPAVELEPAVYEATASALLQRVTATPDQVRCIALVGHNPGFADLVELLVDDDADHAALDAFPTGAIAVLSFAGEWRDLGPGGATLVSAWRPRPPR